MASRFIASAALLLSGVSAWAQTPPTVAPVATTQLPAIQVTAKHTKPHAVHAKPAATPAGAASAQASPPPPYVTGAPNIAGGAAMPPVTPLD